MQFVAALRGDACAKTKPKAAYAIEEEVNIVNSNFARSPMSYDFF